MKRIINITKPPYELEMDAVTNEMLEESINVKIFRCGGVPLANIICSSGAESLGIMSVNPMILIEIGRELSKHLKGKYANV